MEIKLNLYNMKIYLLLLISFLIIQPVFISSLQNIEPQEKIKILKSVTNGFCNIRLKSSYANKFKNYTIEYNDNSY